MMWFHSNNSDPVGMDIAWVSLYFPASCHSRNLRGIVYRCPDVSHPGSSLRHKSGGTGTPGGICNQLGIHRHLGSSLTGPQGNNNLEE